MSEPLYRIRGGSQLRGTVPIHGAKNAALPCLAATLLSAEPCVIHNLPNITDVRLFADILRHLGAEVEIDAEARCARVHAAQDPTTRPPDHLVANQRASFLVMGPLLARCGNSVCAAPGGDVIGQRPLDVHLTGFAALGAEVGSEGGRFHARATRLHGAPVVLDYPSVLGTENLLLAASRAEGRTTIINAAAEPEVACLAEMLNAMGARIRGAGTHTIEIDGVDVLHGVEHTLIPDRIEAGTFAIAAAITGGDVLLQHAQPRHMDAFLFKLWQIGVETVEGTEGVTIRGGGGLQAASVQAVPYPGLPTDLQALMTTLLTQAQGVSEVHERVFENRLQYVPELRKMGAHIVTAGTTAIVHGPAALRGTAVQGLDIRAAAALAVAALAAEGETSLLGISHLERGYECLDQKLRNLGADVTRVPPAG